MNTVPLNIPLPLSAGHIQTPDFKTSVSIPYNVDIAFDTTKLPLEELDCRVGTNIPSVEPCSGNPPILNVQWKLISNSQTIPSTSSSFGSSYSYHKIARHIGRFDSEAGGKYRLELDVLQDATRLSKADPRLEVVPFLDPYEGRLLLGGVAFFFGIIAGVAGLVMVLMSARRERHLRHNL